MKIEHIAMYVHDLERMKAFYTKHFNATANERYHNPQTTLMTYFLTFESGARLELMTREDLNLGSEGFAYGLTHLAFSLGSRGAVDEMTATLIEDGCMHISGPRITGDGYYESCVLDIEGNQIELTV